MATGQRAVAVVDPHLFDPAVGPAVGDGRERQSDPAVLAVDVQDHLLEAALREHDVADVLDRDVALLEPRSHSRDERLERRHALDASAHRVVDQRLAGERLDQRIRLPRQQAVEVRDGHEPVPPPRVQQPLQRRCGEQLGHPRHDASVAQLADPLGTPTWPRRRAAARRRHRRARRRRHAAAPAAGRRRIAHRGRAARARRRAPRGCRPPRPSARRRA